MRKTLQNKEEVNAMARYLFQNDSVTIAFFFFFCYLFCPAFTFHRGSVPILSSKLPIFDSQKGIPRASILCMVHDSPQKICIVGGGFGGVYTALKLDQMPWEDGKRPEITLVDPKDKFVFLPLLYEFATDQADLAEVAPPFSEIFEKTSIKFVQDKATSVDTEERKIHLESEGELLYDKIVLAVGAEPAKSRIPGAKDNALSFYTLDDAYDLRKRIRALKASEKEKIQVVIVGGSYSGVELACSLLDYFGRSRAKITLVDRGYDILKTSTPDNRMNAEIVLNSGGVDILTGAQVENIDEEGSVLINKDIFEPQADPIILSSDLVVLTAGTQPNELLTNVSVEKDEFGRITTGKSLAAKGSPNVFALGDNSVVEGEDLFPTAQVAFQASDYAAWNIWASITGQKKLPFRYVNLGEMMTLGTGKATLSSFGIGIDGAVGSLARRLVYIARQPTGNQILKAASAYVTQSLNLFLPSISNKFNDKDKKI